MIVHREADNFAFGEALRVIRLFATQVVHPVLATVMRVEHTHHFDHRVAIDGCNAQGARVTVECGVNCRSVRGVVMLRLLLNTARA